MWKAVIQLIHWIIKWATYKQRSDKRLDEIIGAIAALNRRTKRLEILDAMHRNDRAVVHQLYDEYKSMGGNSYMQELYKKYIKKGARK